jgi:hypothetical protein
MLRPVRKRFDTLMGERQSLDSRAPEMARVAMVGDARVRIDVKSCLLPLLVPP